MWGSWSNKYSFHKRFILRFIRCNKHSGSNRTRDYGTYYVRRRGKSGCGPGGGGRRGLSDHEATRSWVQIRAQEPIGEDEPNTNVSQRRRGSNIIEQVLQNPSKRTMISLDGGEFTDPKVVRKTTSILTKMFNGSRTTWKEVD
nr:hypothetical protein [Tanacetum cinerariifolium]